MKKIVLFVAMILAMSTAKAQEINATVRVITPQLQKTDRKVFDVLETQIKDFLNNTKWTDDAYDPNERIKCNFTITITTEVGDNSFLGELGVQASRPVFNSGYESPLFTHLDKDLGFSYDLYQSLEFSRDNIDNNLTAILGFYVYTILGLDYDSFSPFGGEQYLGSANQIVNNIPPSITGRYNGWRAGDGGKNRNRYWIAENLLNPRVKSYRLAMYNYYRNGLDLMSSDVEKGRANILSALEEVDKVSTAYFNAMIIQMFANSKKEELIEMWKNGTKAQRERVYQIMIKIDPANANRYKEIGI